MNLTDSDAVCLRQFCADVRPGRRRIAGAGSTLGRVRVVICGAVILTLASAVAGCGGSSSYAGLSSSAARHYSREFIVRVNQERQLGLNVAGLEVGQVAKTKDSEGQAVWAVDWLQPSSARCVRVLVRASDGSHWYGRSALCE